MTKLMTGDLYLKDFGMGPTNDPDKACDFPHEEAVALQRVSNHRYVMVEPTPPVVDLTDAEPPDFKPGDDMVWVRYMGHWFAAERQALFLGTRNALKAHGLQQPLIA